MSVFRKLSFIATGLRHFTTQGYDRHAPRFNKDAFAGVSLVGKHVMITGSNSGIGADATRHFLQLGATVHMVCRSEERAREAIVLLKAQTESPSIHLHLLDVSDGPAVKAFARAFVASGVPLYCLVNNAGAMIHGGKLTSPAAGGIEVNFAINTLGTFILTEELLPSLCAYASGATVTGETVAGETVAGATAVVREMARVVTVSSGGMLTKDLDVGEEQVTSTKEKDGTFTYAQNKRQQVCLTERWCETHESSGIRFQSMHPGWVDTPAIRTSMPDFHKRMEGKLRNLEQGSDTIVWLGASDEALKCKGGGFFLDREPQDKHLTFAWSSYTHEEVESLYAMLTRLKNEVIAEPSPEQVQKYAYLTDGNLIAE
eukprot:TRINITY_DN1229_c0_g2_i1.p1 TRINITY_DN1229_c0_g2~~TRINITY_DN1229_c0_g2_i1.p1  ORF type:complete len:372 (+),score=71.23 TRINITY_DN1229_c0_g2_i1:227-1342(+)